MGDETFLITVESSDGGSFQPARICSWCTFTVSKRFVVLIHIQKDEMVVLLTCVVVSILAHPFPAAVRSARSCMRRCSEN